MESEPEDGEHSVAITLHAVDPDRLDIDALSAGVRAAVLAAGDPELRIVVSGAFEEYVRDKDDLRGELPPYVQARVRGEAIGRVLKLADGSRELLVDASVVDVDREHAQDPARVFMHEALHLVIDDRGESTCYRRARLGYELGTAAGAFAGMAGQIGEEFRVERALREAGHPLERSYREQLGAMARDFAATLADPFWDYQARPTGETLNELLGPAIHGFEDLTPVVAYLVGDDVGAGDRRPPEPEGQGAGEWFAIGYELLYEPLSVLPSATTPSSIENLDALLDPVAEALKSWFAAIGFRWTGGPTEHRLLLDESLQASLADA